ncbi:MAG: Mov34/MPN/PAD-1 family protein [Actinomycetota bacterium]
MERTTIWLPRHLLARIAWQAAAQGETETGGMLVGYEGAAGGEDIVVTSLIDAGPRASHAEYAFNPDGRWQRQQLARVYADSGRIATFIGDWHSHPHGLPLPSEQDVETAQQTAENAGARAPRPLTVIVGRDLNHKWVAAGFRYTNGELVQARLCVFDAEPANFVEALMPRRRREAKVTPFDLDARDRAT